MTNDYQDPLAALKYLDFLNSANGQIQQQVLFKAIKSALPDNRAISILDAGCGPGWLTGGLQKSYNDIAACDSSEFFIKSAKVNYPGIDFKVASLEQHLPYPQKYFDAVILNMAAPDLSNLSESMNNLSPMIKPGGQLIMTVPNPKYTYPAAEWKRSFIDLLLGRKPKLIQKDPPPAGTKIKREFGKNSVISSYYYTTANYISAAQTAGLKLKNTTEIKSEADSKDFDLNYQLFRYPLLILLEFTKI